MDKNKFGNFIKEKRLEHKLTQRELADMLMIDVTAVSKWERGVNFPDITMIPDICRCLDINEHELIESSNDTEYRAARKDAQKYNNIKNALFFGFSVAYAAAVITCFVVNLAVDGRLSWFFIVAASCLCGFCLVPTCARFSKKNKLAVFVGSTLLSLLLLYMTCCIYLKQGWFFTAASATALSYFAAFFPIFFRKREQTIGEERSTREKKYFLILYALGLLALTEVLLLCVSQMTASEPAVSLKIAGYCFSILVAFGIVELLPIHRAYKLCADSVLMGAYLYGLNGVLNSLVIGGTEDCYRVDFGDWAGCSDGNVCLICLLFFALIAIVFAVRGTTRKK